MANTTTQMDHATLAALCQAHTSLGEGHKALLLLQQFSATQAEYDAWKEALVGITRVIMQLEEYVTGRKNRAMGGD